MNDGQCRTICKKNGKCEHAAICQNKCAFCHLCADHHCDPKQKPSTQRISNDHYSGLGWLLVFDSHGTIMHSAHCPTETGFCDERVIGECIYDSILLNPDKERIFSSENSITCGEVDLICLDRNIRRFSFMASPVIHVLSCGIVGFRCILVEKKRVQKKTGRRVQQR